MGGNCVHNMRQYAPKRRESFGIDCGDFLFSSQKYELSDRYTHLHTILPVWLSM